MPRRVKAACAVGAAAALVVLVWVVSAGRAGLAEARPSSNFFDAQARAWFDGRWDLPAEVLSLEAFVIDGRNYTYFGPLPAALRTPVLGITDALDGRLSQPSMLLALIVALAAVSLGWWRVRCAVVGDAPVRTGGLVLAGATVFVAGVGTTLAALASATVVYHEAVLWGVALALVSFVALFRFVLDARLGSLVVAGVAATGALLSRASVGAGPVIALAVVAGVWAVWWGAGRLRRSSDGDHPVPRGRIARWGVAWVPALARHAADELRLGVLVACVAVPVLAYGAVNTAKFGDPFSLPIETQALATIDPLRAEALAANDNNLFGARFVPTTAWIYLRPDGVDLDGLAPWVVFRRADHPVFGDVTFDAMVETASITATMPLLVALAAVGVVTLLRPPRGARRVGGVAAVVAARPVVLGAAGGAAGMFLAGFVANRYVGDALPLLVTAGLVGMHRISLAAVVDSGGRSEGRARRRWLAPVVALGVVAATWGVVANVALAVEYQRLIIPADPDARYDFIRFQHELDGYRTTVPVVAEVPAVARRGGLVAVGDCDALLWSDGTSWHVIEGELDPTLVPPLVPGRGFFDQVVVTDQSAVRDPALCRELVGPRG